MYLTPNSRLKIGNVTFESLNEAIVERSVKDFYSKATITLPRNFSKREGKGVTQFIHKGDVVILELWYGETAVTEFTGYVESIGSATPLIIECDGEWYQHKKNELTPKTIEKATLKQILQYCFPGFQIDCPEVALGTYEIGKVSSYEVVKSIRTTAGFYARINNSDKTINCYYPYDPKNTINHKVVFGTTDPSLLDSLMKRSLFPNIKKNNLVFERKDDVKISITAKAKQRDGKTLTVKVGSSDESADKRTRNYGYEITTEQQLRSAAENDLKRMVFDGYTGTVTMFGSPQVHAGDSLTIIDSENPEREGTYLVEKVKVNYSVNTGFERVVTISYKI